MIEKAIITLYIIILILGIVLGIGLMSFFC